MKFKFYGAAFVKEGQAGLASFSNTCELASFEEATQFLNQRGTLTDYKRGNIFVPVACEVMEDNQ